MNFTRRSFLKTATGLAAGGLLLPFSYGCRYNIFNRPLQFDGAVRGEDFETAHLLRDGKLPVVETKPDNTYDVVIVGAGPCGLSVAWQLQKKGMNSFLVLEKEEKAGGLCIGATENGLSYCYGAHYVSFPEPHNKHLIELFEDCNMLTGTDKTGFPIIKEEFLLNKNVHNIYADKYWLPEEFPFQIANENDKQEFARFEAEMDTWFHWKDANGKPAFGLPFTIISENEEVRRLDRISMKTYLQQRGYQSSLLFWFVNIWLIDEYGTPAENTSAWIGIQYFRPVIFPKQAVCKSDLLSSSKGLGYITEKMCGLIPSDKIKYGVYAAKMQNEDNLVKIVYYDRKQKKFHTVTTKHAVFAVPKCQVYHVIPDLKKAGRTEFANLSYSSWITAAIHLKKLPDYGNSPIRWENTIYNSWTLGYINNQHLTDSSTDEPHILTMYACLAYNTKAERYELLHYDWEYWAKIILHELEKAHPHIEKDIKKIDIWKWGHPMRQTTVGSAWGEQRLKMLQPFGNIHFGHADVCALPIFEETIYRGVEIAHAILSEKQ